MGGKWANARNAQSDRQSDHSFIPPRCRMVERFNAILRTLVHGYLRIATVSERKLYNEHGLIFQNKQLRLDSGALSSLGADSSSRMHSIQDHAVSTCLTSRLTRTYDDLPLPCHLGKKHFDNRPPRKAWWCLVPFRLSPFRLDPTPSSLDAH